MKKAIKFSKAELSAIKETKEKMNDFHDFKDRWFRDSFIFYSFSIFLFGLAAGIAYESEAVGAILFAGAIITYFLSGIRRWKVGGARIEES